MANIPGTANPDILTGTALADLIEGLASDDVLYGFDNNDTLIGGTGDDILYGGSGDDTMDGGTGEDLFFGQSGLDTVTYASALTGLTLNLDFPMASSGDAMGDTFLSVERFILTNHADTLIGSGAADDVFGKDGADLLFGGGGFDTLNGDAGNDTLLGGAEGDVLIGGAGFDFASYINSELAMTLDLVTPSNTSADASGDLYQSIEGFILSDFGDRLVLNGVQRLAYGEGGNDRMTGAATADTLYGGADNDELMGGEGNDLLDGGVGNDRLFGGLGADRFVGGDGVDEVSYNSAVTVNLVNATRGRGDAKGDTFSGIEFLVFLGSGSTYVGGAVDLTVFAVGTTLTAFAGAGAERIEAISGDLTVSYQNAVAAITLTASGNSLIGTRAAVGDVLINSANLTLSGFSDNLNTTGLIGAKPTTILAGNGNDILTLQLIDAVLIGGGGGKDTITGFLRNGQVDAGSGDDTVNLSPQDFGVAGASEVNSGTGNDTILLANYVTNVVDAGDGNDMISIEAAGFSRVNVTGGTGNDSIICNGTLNDWYSEFELYGGSGDDTIDMVASHASVNMVLDGGSGDDIISFKTTDEAFLPTLLRIKGGSGDDQITNLMYDQSLFFLVHQFDANWGDDTITGFRDHWDKIHFNVAGADDFADLTVTGDALQTLITFGTDSILLIGLDVTLLTANDMVFITD